MKSELFIIENRESIENIVVNLLNGNQLMNYNTITDPAIKKRNFQKFFFFAVAFKLGKTHKKASKHA